MIDSRTKATAAGLFSRGLRRQRVGDDLVGNVGDAARSRQPRAVEQPLARRLRRLGKRAEQRQRGDQLRLVRRDLLADDGAHRMADEMRPGDAEAAHAP